MAFVHIFLFWETFKTIDFHGFPQKFLVDKKDCRKLKKQQKTKPIKHQQLHN